MDGWQTDAQIACTLGVKHPTLGRWRQQGRIQAQICNDRGEWLYRTVEELPYPARASHLAPWTIPLQEVQYERCSFDIDMQHCPNCGGGELKIIAAILWGEPGHNVPGDRLCLVNARASAPWRGDREDPDSPGAEAGRESPEGLSRLPKARPRFDAAGLDPQPPLKASVREPGRRGAG
jgi:hypothetical protein